MTYIYDTTDEAIDYICIARYIYSGVTIEVCTELKASSLREACETFEEMLNSDDYEKRRWQVTVEERAAMTCAV